MKLKKALFSGLIALMIAACNSSPAGNGNTVVMGTKSAGNPEIVFREYEHDFGKVDEGEKVAYLFTFDNKGTGDLVINSASTSCGCTVSKYDTKPIAPGGQGTLEVVFNTSGRSGIQTKTITVHNNSKTAAVILKITADVIQKNNK